MTRRKALGILILGVLAITFLFVGPSGRAQAASNAFLRMVHASTGAGPVDVYVNGTDVMPNVQFGTVSTYLPVAAGASHVQVMTHGTSTALVDTTMTLVAGVSYTVAGVGVTGGPFALQAFSDTNTVESGKATVRVYHLSPDAGTVRVTVGGGNGNSVISGLTYKNASQYLLLQPRALAYTFKVITAGGTLDLSATPAAGTVTSVFAIGLQTGTPAMSLVTASVTGTAVAATNATLRVVNAAPGATLVDVFLDGNLTLHKFAFGSVTNYLTVPSGLHTVQVAPAGAGVSASVINAIVTLDANATYTVAALGTSSANFALEIFVDNNVVTSGKAALRMYHLASNAGPINVSQGGTTVITGLTYQNASGYLTLSPNKYTFTVTVVNVNTNVQLPINMPANTVTSVFAVGLLSPTTTGQVVPQWNQNTNLELVVVQVPSIPGLPPTGSDPHALPVSTMQSMTPIWVAGLVMVMLLGTSVVTVRRRHRIHK